MSADRLKGVAGPVVYVLATLDTKGREAAFVRDRLVEAGVPALLVDTGSFAPPAVDPDVTRERIFALAGTTAGEVQRRADRGRAVDAAAEGARRLVLEAYGRGQLAGVIGLGGSAGTVIGTSAMRALPLGVPKLMVSTLASGQVRQYVGEKDVFMLNAIADISGINRISRRILGAAAAAMAGLVTQAARLGAPPVGQPDRPVIALSMFGVTTPCVEAARAIVEAAGYETLVLHATGQGGRVLESLIRDGQVAGVLDITTTELADELVGGVLSAGPERLTAAATAGVPQVVSVGATDMVNFLARSTVPERFAGRTFHQHDREVTLMRTTPDECRAIGVDIARKLAAARGPVAIFLPAGGVSALDRAGKPFDDPAARAALYEAIRVHARGCEIVERPEHINDAPFAEAMARRLLALLDESRRQTDKKGSDGR